MIRQPDKLRKLAVWVGKNAFFKAIFHPFYRFYVTSLTKKRKRLFRKNGIYVLKEFDLCMRENDIPYSLAFGTMLGAVREHGFIKHDFDIDVAIWSEDYHESIREALCKKGFILIHTLLVDEGKSGREETYEMKNVTIDIFYIYPPINDYPYCCDFLSHDGSVSFADSMEKYGFIIPRRIQLPWKKEFMRVQFEDIMLPVPINSHEILSYRYGDDYKIPNPQWHYIDANKYVTVWDNKRGVMKK